jgi:hypothetical protein
MLTICFSSLAFSIAALTMMSQPSWDSFADGTVFMAPSFRYLTIYSVVENHSCRLLKKISESRRADFVVRVRPSTRNEHVFREAIERNYLKRLLRKLLACESFSAAC